MAAKSSAVVVVVLLVVDFDDVVQELEGPLPARQEVRQRQRLPRAEQWQGSSSAERQLSGSADLMRGFSSCRKVHWSSSPSRSNSLAHLMALSRASPSAFLFLFVLDALADTALPRGRERRDASRATCSRTRAASRGSYPTRPLPERARAHWSSAACAVSRVWSGLVWSCQNQNCRRRRQVGLVSLLGVAIGPMLMRANEPSAGAGAPQPGPPRPPRPA